MASDERVTLNVGGTRFEIPRKTLGRFPESLLGPLSDPEASHELQHEANDVYFFDRYVNDPLLDARKRVQWHYSTFLR